MTNPAARIGALATEIGALAAQLDQGPDAPSPLAPHPDTLDLLQRRGVTRSQIHPNVPDALALSDRLRSAGRDLKLNQGDVAAVALDAWLRANGYPPPAPPASADA